MRRYLAEVRGPRAAPKAKCHGCGVCFPGRRKRVFEEDLERWFAPHLHRLSARYYRTSTRRNPGFFARRLRLKGRDRAMSDSGDDKPDFTPWWNIDGLKERLDALPDAEKIERLLAVVRGQGVSMRNIRDALATAEAERDETLRLLQERNADNRELSLLHDDKVRLVAELRRQLSNYTTEGAMSGDKPATLHLADLEVRTRAFVREVVVNVFQQHPTEAELDAVVAKVIKRLPKQIKKAHRAARRVET